MALRGPFSEVRRLRRQLAELARPGSTAQRQVMAGVVPVVKQLFAEQFKSGTDPSGAVHKPRVDGKPALVSEKLARGALKVEVVGTGLVAAPKTKHIGDILTTQDEGHVFAPQSVTQFRLRGKTATASRLVSKTKFLRRVAETAVYHRKGSDTWTYTKEDKRGRARFRGERRVVQVGLRVLQARRLKPDGTSLPQRYRVPIARAMAEGIRALLSRVDGG